MMGFLKLIFEKLWTNSADFPTLEESETKVREDYQYHPDAIKNYLNNSLIPEMEAELDQLASGLKDANERVDAIIISDGTPIDPTLTKSGWAADAKAVGDALAKGGIVGASVTIIDLTSVTVDSSASAFNGQSITGNVGMTGDELYAAWLAGPVIVKYTDSAGGEQTALVTSVMHTEGSTYLMIVSAMNAKYTTVPAAMELSVAPATGNFLGRFYPVASPMPSWTAKEGSINYIADKPTVVQTVNGAAPDANGNVTVTGTQGPAGPSGYTPVKGVDYFTEADKDELKEEIAAELEVTLPNATAISVVKSGTSVTFTETLEEGTSEIVLELDESGVPIGMTVDGGAVSLTMEGF